MTSAEQQHGKLVTDRDRYRQTASTAHTRAAEARRDFHIADQNAAAATQVVQVTSEAATVGLRRPAAETALSDALQQLGAAIAARKAATAEITASLQTAAQARADRSTWQRARDALGVEEAAADPGGNLAVVEAAWAALRDELTAAEQGLVEAEFLNRAQRKLNEAIERRSRFEQPILDRASELAVSTAASSRESLIGAQRRARASAAQAEKDRLRAETEHDQATLTLQAAAPTSGDRQNHFDLSNTPQWLPATPAEIPPLLERLEMGAAPVEGLSDLQS